MGRTQPSLIPSTDLQLTMLMTFQDRYLVSWSQNHLWILDPVGLKVLGQTTSLRNVRCTISNEADLYIFHDGYQIFRKISLQPEYVVKKVITPELPAQVPSVFSEGDIIQEVNGKLITSHDKDLYDSELSIHDQLEKYPMLQSDQINNSPTTTTITTTTNNSNNNNECEVNQTVLYIKPTQQMCSNSYDSVGSTELIDTNTTDPTGKDVEDPAACIKLSSKEENNRATDKIVTVKILINDIDGYTPVSETQNITSRSNSPKNSTIHMAAGLQNRLIEKLPFNEDLLKKTKSFFKESVGPILEKTTTSFLKQTTQLVIPSEEIETKDNTKDDSQEVITPNKSEIDPSTLQPDAMCAFAFASKAEQSRRLAVLQPNEDEDLVVNIVKKKTVRGKQKRHKKSWLNLNYTLNSIISTHIDVYIVSKFCQ